MKLTRQDLVQLIKEELDILLAEQNDEEEDPDVSNCIDNCSAFGSGPDYGECVDMCHASGGSFLD